MSWLSRIDALLFVAGLVLAVAGVTDGLRAGRSLASMLQSTWFYSSGLLFALGGLVLIVILFRWRASREEADLLRKYPPRTR